MRAPGLLPIILAGLAACSPTADPEERRASLRRLFERAQSEQLRERVREESRAAAKRTAVRAGQTFPNAAGRALAASIRYSRTQALNAGARPLPPEIKRELAPYFEAAMLEKVRWNTAGRRLSLGSVLAGWYQREGAVTLGDAIVFSDEKAAGRRLLWAHELTHVEQYEELGIEGFALLYTTEWAELEERARENARSINRRIEAASAADDPA